MKNNKRLSWSLLKITFVIFFVFSSFSSVFAAQGDIYFDASGTTTQEVASGQSASLELFVDVGASNLGAWTIDIDFGTSILVWIDDGTSYADGSSMTGATIVNNLTNAASGTIRLNGLSTTGITGTSGIVSLATLTLAVTGSPLDSQAITITVVSLGDNTATPFPSSNPITETVAIPTAPLDHFTISTIGTQTAGTPFNITTITAIDTNGATKIDFTSTATITSTGTLSSGDTTASFTAGVLSNHSVTISNTGPFTITATSGSATGTSNAFTVNPGTIDHIVITPASTTACPTQTVTYTATGYDSLNNATGDVTSATTFGISTGADGTWASNVYTAETSGGPYTVTGTHAVGAVGSDTASLTVRPTYTLTLAKSPTAGGTVTATTTALIGSNTYCANSVVTITASPAGGYQFNYWSGDVANTASATTTVTMDSDKTVTAYFGIAEGAAPEAQSLSPTVISNDVANTISIYGINFSSNYTYNFFMTWISDYDVSSAACEGDLQLTVTRVSTTKATVTVPANTTSGVYNVTVCIAGQDAVKDGTSLQLRIAAPAVTNEEQDEISTVVTAAATSIQSVSTVLPDYDSSLPLTNTELSALGLDELIAYSDVVDFKVETVGGVTQLTATTTEPVKPTSTGTIPIQYTLKSTNNAIDTEKAVEIRATIPKSTAVTDASGNPYTGSILPPSQEVVPDDIQDDFGGTAVAFSMGSGTETLNFSPSIYLEFDVTLPDTAAAPKIYQVSTTGAATLAGVTGQSPSGVGLRAGGKILTKAVVGSEVIYNIGVLLEHMSSYVVGDYSPELDDSSSISCFVSSLVSSIRTLPGIVTILMMIGSVFGIAVWRRNKD